MDERWMEIAERVVDALGVQDGEVVQLRDRTGRFEIVQELLIAIERRGAAPLPLILQPAYLQRLLASTDPAILAGWDRRRLGWLEATDRVLVLAGADGDLSTVPPDAAGAWGQAVERLTRAEDSRRLPYLLAAIPTTARAERLGMSLSALEDQVVPALLAQPSELRREVDRVLAAMDGARTLTIRSGASCELHIELGDRAWLSDTGAMPAPDSLAAGVRAVQNLPAGAVYTTVVEAAASGALWLPEAAGAREVTLHFDGGRIVSVEAMHGGNELAAMFDQHTGEPRRISHIGIGLNPHLQRAVRWTLVDEHRHGAVLIAFGENRYLGGQNASSLNIDFAIPDADLLANNRAIVAKGRLV